MENKILKVIYEIVEFDDLLVEEFKMSMNDQIQSYINDWHKNVKSYEIINHIIDSKDRHFVTLKIQKWEK